MIQSIVIYLRLLFTLVFKALFCIFLEGPPIIVTIFVTIIFMISLIIYGFYPFFSQILGMIF